MLKILIIFTFSIIAAQVMCQPKGLNNKESLLIISDSTTANASNKKPKENGYNPAMNAFRPILSEGFSWNDIDSVKKSLSRFGLEASQIKLNESKSRIYIRNVQLPVLLKVYDTSGHLIYGKIMNTSYHFDVHQLDKGTYFMIIQNYGHSKAFKFVLD